MPLPIQCQDVISVFNGLFAVSHNTLLLCALCDRRFGDLDEPVYEPVGGLRASHQIVFAHCYFASALHKVSHWCVAGKAGLLLDDFGYWYRPDGRTERQQKQFEKVEIKPQALEWLFSLANQRPFVASANNLTSKVCDDLTFRLAVSAQARAYFTQGLPPQAQLFLVQLQKTYAGQMTLEQL